MNRDLIRIVEPDILFDESITIDLGGVLKQAYQSEATLFVESHGRPLDRAAFQKELRDWEQLALLFSEALEWFMGGAASQ